jgi:hypothetical protein
MDLQMDRAILIKFLDEIIHHSRKGIGGLPTPLRSRLLLVEPEYTDLPEKFHGTGVRVKRQAGARNPASYRRCQFFRGVGSGYAGNDIDHHWNLLLLGRQTTKRKSDIHLGTSNKFLLTYPPHYPYRKLIHKESCNNESTLEFEPVQEIEEKIFITSAKCSVIY